jgi:uncharacterized Tic20 family protein
MEEHPMSDTTPRPADRPDEPAAEPADPTAAPREPSAPPPPAAETPPPAAETPAAPAQQIPYPIPPATQPYDPSYARPYGQQAFGQRYDQQAYGPPQVPQPVEPGQQPPAYGAAPGQALTPTPMNPNEERTWGMLSHGITLAVTVVSGGTLGFVTALVIYLMVKDRGPFVRHHSANALNVQIVAGIVMLISIPLMFVLVGFLTFAAAWVFAVVVHIIGAVKANNGEWYTPPLTPQIAK